MKVRFLDIIMKILVGLTIFLWILALVKPELIKDILHWANGAIQSLGYWNYVIIFTSSFIEVFPVLWVVVPGQNIMIISGGFFGSLSTNYLITSIVVASSWAVLGNYVGYVLGVYYGDFFFKHYGYLFWLGKTEVNYMKWGIKKWWPIGMIVWKFHNLARAFLPFLAGSMGMKTKSFMIYNTIGSVVRATSMILIGVVFAKNYETIIDYLGYIVLGSLVIAGLYIYLFKRAAFMKYLDEKNKEIDEMIETSRK